MTGAAGRRPVIPRPRRRALPFALLAAALVLWPRTIGALDLVASLSNHLVAITTGFTGSSVLLFGAVDGEGDVVVVARGPDTTQVVRRKARRFGIWINERQMVFEAVPGFYALAASRPLPLVFPDGAPGLYQIGVDKLRLIPQRAAAADDIRAFRAALVRTMQRERLYGSQAGEIRFLGNRLFRTDLWIPANAPVGNYTVSVYLVQAGDVVNAEITPLVVSRVGFEARVYDFAQRSSIAYGILALVIAAAAGWLANVIFRKA